jgi:hypothetical protein
MHWVQLTQANTGVTIHVNMDMVIVVVPNRRGGANLMLPVREPSPKGGKDSARLIPVKESPAEVMKLVELSKRN